MTIERNERIRFHPQGTLDAVTRWIANHHGGNPEDEDLGTKSETGTIALPPSMVQWLQVDLAVWRPDTPES